MDMQQQLFTAALKIEDPIFISEVAFESNELHIYLDYDRTAMFPCHECGEEHGTYDFTPRVWRHLNFFQYKCYLHFNQPRVDCPKCGVHSFTPEWTRERSGFTLLFEAFAVALAKSGMPFSVMGEMLGEHDTRLRRIIDHYVEKAYEAKDMGGVVDIAVDETSSKKGHNYVTVVSDQANGDVLFVTKGKDEQAIAAFTAEAPKHGLDSKKIERVTMDMSPAFQLGHRKYLQQATLVFDRFHIVKLLNEAVDQVRREEQKTNPLLKKTRYIWLKNRSNLTAKQESKLVDLSQLNLQTAEAYRLKVTFQDIFTGQLFVKDAEAALVTWLRMAEDSGMAPIMKFVETIKSHFMGVISFFRNRITNGVSEGINSIIQQVKRRARGYKNMRHFINMIYLVHGGLNLPDFPLKA